MDTRQTMSLEQFTNLVARIQHSHTWPAKGRGIKYIRPAFDMRQLGIYGITFDCLDGPHEFYLVNENRNRNLAKWIDEWLEGAKLHDF